MLFEVLRIVEKVFSYLIKSKVYDKRYLKMSWSNVRRNCNLKGSIPFPLLHWHLLVIILQMISWFFLRSLINFFENFFSCRNLKSPKIIPNHEKNLDLILKIILKLIVEQSKIIESIFQQFFHKSFWNPSSFHKKKKLNKNSLFWLIIHL